MYFNPRTPCGVRLAHVIFILAVMPEFQSTHPVWGATKAFYNLKTAWRISIHAPRVGCDSGHRHPQWCHRRFQSTHPVWGATPWKTYKGPKRLNFNPRTPCGVRQLYTQVKDPATEDFNPRTPCGVRRIRQRPWPTSSDFNPRTPCGVRLYILIPPIVPHRRFQSTHPVWGATCRHMRSCRSLEISIHAPRVGCDSSPARASKLYRYFNPRTPCGVRQNCPHPGEPCNRFQSTHPVWGATGAGFLMVSVRVVFQSTHPVWGATCQPCL